MCAQGRKDCGFYDAIELPEMSVCVSLKKPSCRGGREEGANGNTKLKKCIALLQPKYLYLIHSLINSF